MPIFASMEVNAANTAEPIAMINHIVHTLLQRFQYSKSMKPLCRMRLLQSGFMFLRGGYM